MTSKNSNHFTEDLCKHILMTNRLDQFAFYLLAYTRYQNKDFTAAMSLVKKALDTKPDFPEACNLLGLLFYEDKQFDNAQQCFILAIKLDKNFAEAYCNLGLVFKAKGKLNAAIACYKKAIKLNKDYYQAYNNLGTAYFEKNAIDDAFETYQKAVIINPAYASAYCNLGNVVREKGYSDLALGYYEKSIELEPQFVNAKWNYALSHLQLGNYKKGFELYESRRLLPDYNPIIKLSQGLQYNGEDAKDKVLLLYTEQGFGDSIQFIRFVPNLLQKVGEIILLCPKELVRIFHYVSGIKKVICPEDPLPHYDMHCSLMSLPYVLGLDINEIKQLAPYINLPNMHHPALELLNTKKMKVGLVLHGSHPKKKSLHVSDIKSLLKIAGKLQVFYLIVKLSDIDLQEYRDVVDISAYLTDFLDTAILLKHLDLLISVDTATLHLAGAMGVKAWGILHYAADWRWGLKSDKSIWYESIRLFRQVKYDDYSEPLKQIEERLLKKADDCVD